MGSRLKNASERTADQFVRFLEAAKKAEYARVARRLSGH